MVSWESAIYSFMLEGLTLETLFWPIEYYPKHIPIQGFLVQFSPNFFILFIGCLFGSHLNMRK